MELFKKSILVIVLIITVTGCKNISIKSDEVSLEEESLGKLHYSVPSVFKKSKESTESKVYYHYIEKYDKNKCTLSLSYMKPFNKNLDIIVRSYLYSSEEYRVRKQKINGQTWKHAIDSKRSDKIYYSYAIIYQDMLYAVQYDDAGTGNYCDEAFNSIIKSLKFKE